MDIVTFIETAADPNDPEWAYQFCAMTVKDKPVSADDLPRAPWEIATKDGSPIEHAGLRLYRAPKAHVLAERRCEKEKADWQVEADLAKYDKVYIYEKTPPISLDAILTEIGRESVPVWVLDDQRWIGEAPKIDGYARCIEGAWVPMSVTSNLTDAQFRALTKD